MKRAKQLRELHLPGARRCPPAIHAARSISAAGGHSGGWGDITHPGETAQAFVAADVGGCGDRREASAKTAALRAAVVVSVLELVGWRGGGKPKYLYHEMCTFFLS